jgi:hypothetical protein
MEAEFDGLAPEGGRSHPSERVPDPRHAARAHACLSPISRPIVRPARCAATGPALPDVLTSISAQVGARVAHARPAAADRTNVLTAPRTYALPV